MKNVLIFGDSNTWGWNPDNTLASIERFADDVRWAGVMQGILGEEYHVIPEGLNGRTTVWDDPIEEFRCGKHHLIPLLDTHDPLDLVIIFIGSNDLKSRYALTAEDIAFGVNQLVIKTKDHVSCFRNGEPKVFLVTPPPTGPLKGSIFEYMFKGSEETSKHLAKHFAMIAAGNGVPNLDAGQYVASSQQDGVHLTRESHQKLGEVMAEEVKRILG
jgi:lysophospholipase L1-like esterase